MIDTSGPAAMPRPARQQRHHWRFGPHNLRMNFRRWRRTRPFWGGLWAILGGLICAVGPASAIKLLIASGTTVWLGIMVGVLISIFGLFLWFAPQQRHLVGVLIAVLSVVSLVTSDFGGFAIGMLLGITGGALGFAWVPAAPKVRRHRLFRRHAVEAELGEVVVPVIGEVVSPVPVAAELAVTGTAEVSTQVEKTGAETERVAPSSSHTEISPGTSFDDENGDGAAEPAAPGQRGRFRRFWR